MNDDGLQTCVILSPQHQIQFEWPTVHMTPIFTSVLLFLSLHIDADYGNKTIFIFSHSFCHIYFALHIFLLLQFIRKEMKMC